MNQRTCQHTGILFRKFTVFDEQSKLTFDMCEKCWKSIRHLFGYRLVEVHPPRQLTEAEKRKLKTDVPF